MRFELGRAAAVVAVLGIAGACADGPEPERDDAATEHETSTTSVPLARADLGGLEAAGIAVERVEPRLGDGERIEADPLRVNGIVVVDGSTLLVWVSGTTGGSFLERSRDLGETWERADLPGAPDGVRTHLTYPVGDEVVVTGSTADVWSVADGFIWTSDDGTTWNGGPVPTAPRDTTLVGDVEHLADGRLAMPVYRPGRDGGPPDALASGDNGASWQPIGCPPEWSWNDDDCTPPPAVAGLWLRASQVSLDEGTTWQPFAVEPATPSPTQVETAVALPAGGWLGLGSHSSPGLNRFGSVLRSDDGVRWQEVLADPCSDITDERVESVFGSPVALGDRWLVTHTCFLGWQPQRSGLYLLDQDGGNPDAVASVDEPGLYFGRPTTVDDTVIVPELDTAGPTTLLHLSA